MSAADFLLLAGAAWLGCTLAAALAGVALGLWLRSDSAAPLDDEPLTEEQITRLLAMLDEPLPRASADQLVPALAPHCGCVIFVRGHEPRRCPEHDTASA